MKIYEDMYLFGDYHTHTQFSHGKGSVMENALAAKQIGLKEIAITDHGFGHNLYAVKRKDFAKLKQEAALAEQETGIKVYVGVEANFLSESGKLDVTEEDLKNIDVLLVGYHRFVKNSFLDKFRFTLYNLIFGKKASKKAVARNTNMLLNAMDKYPIDVLTHLKHGLKIDLMAVAKKAAETNTYIELNQSKMLFSYEEILDMHRLGVKFIINTDAHEPSAVGKADDMLMVIEQIGIPLETVVNINKAPKFKRK